MKRMNLGCLILFALCAFPNAYAAPILGATFNFESKTSCTFLDTGSPTDLTVYNTWTISAVYPDGGFDVHLAQIGSFSAGEIGYPNTAGDMHLTAAQAEGFSNPIPDCPASGVSKITTVLGTLDVCTLSDGKGGSYSFAKGYYLPVNFSAQMTANPSGSLQCQTSNFVLTSATIPSP